MYDVDGLIAMIKQVASSSKNIPDLSAQTIPSLDKNGLKPYSLTPRHTYPSFRIFDQCRHGPILSESCNRSLGSVNYPRTFFNEILAFPLSFSIVNRP